MSISCSRRSKISFSRNSPRIALSMRSSGEREAMLAAPLDEAVSKKDSNSLSRSAGDGLEV